MREMNKTRRKEINKCKTDLEYISNKLQSILDDEQIAFDNMPEGLQCSVRGMDSEDAINSMETAKEYLENAITSIQSAIDSLDDII
jgi:exonuclease VII small subunit